MGEGFHLGTGVNREVAKHVTCLAVWTWRARAENAEAEVERLRTALQVVQAWDAINPPPNDGSDLKWLKAVVENALRPTAAPTKETP